MSLKPLICICVLLAVCTGLNATVPEGSANGYANIPDRNVFGLKPPQKITETAPPPLLPKIVLTGITTILGNKRALMKTQPAAPGKPGEQAKELSLILTEGQREGDIEVLQIDEKLGSVKLNNSGTVMTLTFEKDGAKLPATPAPPPYPVGATSVVAGIPAPATNPAAFNSALTNAPGMHPLPTRNFRLPAARSVPASAPGGAAALQPAIGGVPTPTGLVPAPAVVTPPADLTPEEQAILQQIQREAASPLPPGLSNVPAPGSATAVPVLPQ